MLNFRDPGEDGELRRAWKRWGTSEILEKMVNFGEPGKDGELRRS
jgi:hypothetical protein